MYDYEIPATMNVQIEIVRNYSMVEWRDDIKKLLRRAGCDGRPQVFLFADSQIKDEAFIEDINMILNTGDVPNLYPSDEKAEILEKMMEVARESVCNIVYIGPFFK